MAGREPKRTDLDAGAQALWGSWQDGATAAQGLQSVFSELSEQSGVAKSIISQIERNETNPTLATIWRLSQALDISIERVLASVEEEPFLDHLSRADTPLLVSEDGKCRHRRHRLDQDGGMAAMV